MWVTRLTLFWSDDNQEHVVFQVFHFCRKAKEETRKAKRNENGLEHKSGQNETNPQNSMPDKEDVIDDFNMKDYDIEEGTN